MNGAKILAWDTDFFGFPIAQVERTPAEAPDLRAAIAACAAEGIACLYFLAGSEEFASTSLAEDLGFRLVDIRLRLELDLTRQGVNDAPHPKDLARPFRIEDLSALRKLASENHAQSRFFRDPGFPRDRVRAFYAHWLEKACADSENSAAFVAEVDGHPSGYVTCMAGPGKTGRIVLAGVEARHRGRGLGTALVARAVGWFRGQGLDSCSVVTQGGNIPAQRLYTSNGFYPLTSELWFHKWFRPLPPDRK